MNTTTIAKALYLMAMLGVSAGMAQARIGWTLAECRTHYEKEVKNEKAWCGGTAYSFIQNGLYIYAIIGANGKVGDIMYFDNKKTDPLKQELTQILWKENQGGKIYDNDDPYLWNGRRQYKKKLGLESGFSHWVEYSWDGTEGLVEYPKKNGWQIRTLDQFKTEQVVIKRLIQEDKEKEKGHVTVGALTRVK